MSTMRERGSRLKLINNDTFDGHPSLSAIVLIKVRIRKSIDN